MTEMLGNAMASHVSLNRGDRAQELAILLRRQIVSGQLLPGMPLRQEELARSFDTSRIPVREALRLLQAQGLVQLEPNKGAIVTPLQVEDLREITEMRDAAERLAMKTALPHLSNAQIDLASTIQDEIEQSDIADYGRLNKELHLTLYRFCDRPRLLEHISNLHDAAERYLGFTLTQLDYVAQSSTEHRAILDACYSRDENKVLKLLSLHILEAGATLEKSLRS